MVKIPSSNGLQEHKVTQIYEECPLTALNSTLILQLTMVKYILEHDFSMQVIEVNLFLCSPFSTPLVKQNKMEHKNRF